MASSAVKLEFFKSATSKLNLNSMIEVVLIGKSNAGKSSFINNLGNNRKLAYISQTPGKTVLLNYYKLEEKAYLIDTPGYGYHAKNFTKSSEFDAMMESLLVNNTKIKLIFWIYDIRRNFDDFDANVLLFLKQQSVQDKIILVLTKIDKISRSAMLERVKYFQNTTDFEKKDIFYISNQNKTNIDQVQNYIKKAVLIKSKG